MMARKPAKYPVYNPDVDGSPFVWIIQTSARIREENINGQRPQSISQGATLKQKSCITARQGNRKGA